MATKVRDMRVRHHFHDVVVSHACSTHNWGGRHMGCRAWAVVNQARLEICQRVVGWMHGWMVGWMHGWVDGWSTIRTDVRTVRTYGQVYSRMHTFILACFHTCIPANCIAAHLHSCQPA